MNDGTQEAWNFTDTKFSKYLTGAYRGNKVQFTFTQQPLNTTAQQYVPVYFYVDQDAYHNVTEQAYVAHVWECFMQGESGQIEVDP